VHTHHAKLAPPFESLRVAFDDLPGGIQRVVVSVNAKSMTRGGIVPRRLAFILDGVGQSARLRCLEDMPMVPRVDHNFRMLAEAVNAWFAYYEVEPHEQAYEALSTAALSLYHQGHRNLEDLSTMLIGTHVGPWAVRVNAPSSDGVH
jgi:hypothetical protein